MGCQRHDLRQEKRALQCPGGRGLFFQRGEEKQSDKRSNRDKCEREQGECAKSVTRGRWQ